MARGGGSAAMALATQCTVLLSLMMATSGPANTAQASRFGSRRVSDSMSAARARRLQAAATPRQLHEQQQQHQQRQQQLQLQ